MIKEVVAEWPIKSYAGILAVGNENLKEHGENIVTAC